MSITALPASSFTYTEINMYEIHLFFTIVGSMNMLHNCFEHKSILGYLELVTVGKIESNLLVYG